MSSNLGQLRRQGFETRFEYLGFAGQVFAEGIGADGRSLGKSEVAITSTQLPPKEGVPSKTEAEQEQTTLPQKRPDKRPRKFSGYFGPIALPDIGQDFRDWTCLRYRRCRR